MNTWIPLMAPAGAEFDFTAGQLFDLIGWAVITALALAALIGAAARISPILRAAERGVTWPVTTQTASVAAAWYLTGQIPGPRSWTLPITSTYALLCDSVTSLALIAHFTAFLMLLPLLFLAVFALSRWAQAPADPARFGTLSRIQVAALWLRRLRSERRLAAELGGRAPSDVVSWSIEHADTPPAEPGEPPTVETWFVATTEVSNTAAIRARALAAPMVSGAALRTGDSGTTRLCVAWDVNALTGIHPPARPLERPARRARWWRPRPAALAALAPKTADTPVGSRS
jgi:hypothetical protein